MLSAFSGFTRSTAPVKAGALTLACGLAAAGVLSGAGTALADGRPQTQNGATATINGLKTYGEAVIHEDGGTDLRVPAGLFDMSVDGGGTLQTYCVDLHNPTQRDAKYQETPWSGTSLGANANAGRIRWILQNSYPQVNDLDALARKAGATGLTEQDAAAGTQVAIWRYSDAAKVDAADPQAEKLADYLEKSARPAAEPRASLTLDPPAVSGRPGDLLGPVTVHTDAAGVIVSPPADAAAEGMRIIDRTGKVITSAHDGSRLYFDIPEGAPDATVQVAVQASTTVPVGRAFASESRSQTQILAGSSESTVSATVDASWAAEGAVPAVSARKNCAKGGVDVTVADKGDAPFTFDIMGTSHTVAPGKVETITVPLKEDQSYDFTVTGPGGFTQRFTGILDCATQGPATAASAQTLSEPTPITLPGEAPTGTDLAATGGSALTPVITGAAIGLVVIGGAVLVILRGRENKAGE
ncbi:Cys-Gln thioester bond-forming surface protein [Streptomyces griseoluteus]|uniref:Cys-Gln thioester bond-forming surface protein n=1 Tax=Streptomyces griseoluteus TaxID=29306 RepID=UPI003649A30D